VDIYRTKLSEITPVRFVRQHNGRKIKLIDKSFLENSKQRKPTTKIHKYIQLLFFLITFWIGIDFYFFVSGLENGIAFRRPPGVEGFLPISSLVSFRYFILTGIVNRVHPFGFFIFNAMVLGFWQNNISGSEYIRLFKNIDMVSHGF